MTTNKQLQNMTYQKGIYRRDEKKPFLFTLLCNSDIKLATKLFRMVGPLEQELGEDCCMFSPAVAEAFIKERFMNMTTRWRMVYIYMVYCQWCVLKGYARNNVINQIQLEELKAVRDQYVSSASDLKLALDEIFDDERKNTYDLVFRASLWFAFSGLKTERAFRVKRSDVDLVKMGVWSDGYFFAYPKQAAYSVRAAATMDEMNYYHPNYVSLRPRFQSEQVLRGFLSEANKNNYKSALRKAMRSAKESGQTNRTFTFNDIWYSGLFSKMAEDEKAIGYMSEEIIYQIIINQYHDAMSMYNMDVVLNLYRGWKLAFYSNMR